VQNEANISSSNVIDYKVLYEGAQQRIEYLELQLMQLKKLLEGNKQERFVSSNTSLPEQGVLFNVEPIAEVITETKLLPAREVKKSTVVSKHKGRECFPAHLHREVITIEPEGITTDNARVIGEDVTELLAYTPCELFVKQIRRPRYATTAAGTVVQAPAPVRTLEKCSADNSLVAQVTVEKYVDHLPLYRQIKRYERLGVTISDSTIGDWLRQVAHALAALYEEHKKAVLNTSYLHVDETIIKVMSNEKKHATHQGYYWVYQSHHNKLVLFDYRRGRGREGPETILKDFKGHIQTDGYAGYDVFKSYPDITVFHCMAHARRKFHEALSNDKDRASYAMEQIQQLYAIERTAKEAGITGAALTAYRKEHAVPILESMEQWMKKAYLEVLPKSAIGKALEYSLLRWKELSLYASDGMLHLDNNPVENSIRPVAIGRKNYLFAGSHDAAQRAAIFYSLFATCKLHGVNPYDWLKYVLDNLIYYKPTNLIELLPQHFTKIQQHTP
jgi:transposase